MKYRSGPSRLSFPEQAVQPETDFERDFTADGEHGPACEAAMVAAGAIVVVPDIITPANPAAITRTAAATPAKE